MAAKKRKALAWPAIPKRIEGAGGPITVKLVRAPRVEGCECWGSWDDGRRVIELDRSADREHQHRTLYHEETHAALDDAGLCELLSVAGNEAVCRAVASARIRKLRGELEQSGT